MGKRGRGAFEFGAVLPSPTPVTPELPPLWLFALGLLVLGWLGARRRGR